ncbi:hypothetical protein MMC18_009123 [Xylographa bjoerkii]|nr:hypothetical protein [Xylographa bjoerkii]
MGVASGSLNVLSDFSILILPLPTIWRLQMSKKNKLAVTAVFAIGFFASVTSILRLVYSIDLLRLAADTAASQTDIDTTGLWSIAEIAVGIIVGCLPVLPRFFRHFVPKRSPPLSDSETLLNSSSGRSFWRKLFRKSAALDASNEKIRVAFQSVSSGTKTKATPPQISTMNFTSHSLHMAGNDLTRPPSPRSGSGTDIDLEGQYSSQANHEAGKTKQHPKEKMNVEDEGDGGAGY